MTDDYKASIDDYIKHDRNAFRTGIEKLVRKLEEERAIIERGRKEAAEFDKALKTRWPIEMPEYLFPPFKYKLFGEPGLTTDQFIDGVLHKKKAVQVVYLKSENGIAIRLMVTIAVKRIYLNLYFVTRFDPEKIKNFENYESFMGYDWNEITKAIETIYGDNLKSRKKKRRFKKVFSNYSLFKHVKNHTEPLEVWEYALDRVVFPLEPLMKKVLQINKDHPYRKLLKEYKSKYNTDFEVRNNFN